MSDMQITSINYAGKSKITGCSNDYYPELSSVDLGARSFGEFGERYCMVLIKAHGVNPPFHKCNCWRSKSIFDRLYSEATRKCSFDEQKQLLKLIGGTK